MNRDKQLKDFAQIHREKRRWQVVAAILLGCLALLVLTLFGKSTSTKTIFIPPNAGVTDKPFWVADSGASPEYFQMSADYVAQLALTTDVKSAPYNLDRLLAITHPSLKGTLKAELDAVTLKMKQENVMQAFYPMEYYTADQQPVAAIKGTLKTWVGDKLTSNRQVVYRMAFQMDAGRIWLTEFRETTPVDPLNGNPTTRATP